MGRRPAGGFSTAAGTVRPVIAKGDYGYPAVNVSDQQRDPDSLLRWFQSTLPVLRECPEIGTGTCTVLDTRDERVLALRYDLPTGSVLTVLNLAEEAVTVDLAPQPGVAAGYPADVLSDQPYGPAGDLTAVELAASGYRWIRLARTVGA